MIDKLFTFIILLLGINLAAQERVIEKTTVDYKVVSELKIPQNSYWENFDGKWNNRDGIISKIYILAPSDFPDFYILVTPTYSIIPEYVTSKIVDYDKVEIHAYPEHILLGGYNWYLIHKSELKPSTNIKVFSLMWQKSKCFDVGHFSYRLEIKKEDFLESLYFWQIYYSDKNQRRLKRKYYKYGEKHDYDYDYISSEYFSMVEYKDVVRFNLGTGFSARESGAYLETSYYEIPKLLWKTFIETAELNQDIGFICGEDLIKF